MVYPLYGMFDAAKMAHRSHQEDCEECITLGLSGDMCPEGARLLEKARELYESIQDGPPELEE